MIGVIKLLFRLHDLGSPDDDLSGGAEKSLSNSLSLADCLIGLIAKLYNVYNNIIILSHYQLSWGLMKNYFLI
jgi:hypothetical protein